MAMVAAPGALTASPTSTPDSQTGAAPRGSSGAKKRNLQLDFFRGLAMFIILINHTPGNFIKIWTPSWLGLSDAADTFVFCSGIAVAMAFATVFAERGWWMGAARIAHRMWQVYWSHIGLFFAIAVTMVLLNTYGFDNGYAGDQKHDWFVKDYVGGLNLWPFFENHFPGDESATFQTGTESQLLGLMTLTYVPNYFDILPMYLVMLGMTPFVILAGRISPIATMAVLVGMWLLSNKPLLEEMGLAEYRMFIMPAEPWAAREWFFNPFAWQLVFFTGFAFARGWLPIPPRHTGLIILAGIILVLSIPFAHYRVRAGLGLGEIYGPIREATDFLRSKTYQGPLRFAYFLCLAYFFWAVSGPEGRNLTPGVGALGRVWNVILSAIVKVGQQSLAVFMVAMWASIFMGFVLDVFVDAYGWTPDNSNPRTVDSALDKTIIWAVNIAGCALLIATAYSVAWFKSQPWRRKSAAAPVAAISTQNAPAPAAVAAQ